MRKAHAEAHAFGSLLTSHATRRSGGVRLAALLILALLAMGCSTAVERKSMEPVPAKTYLALGDSYTIGEAVPEADRWPVQLAGLLRADGIAVEDPKIVATTGWTTAELMEGISNEKLGKYDLVSLLIGVNNQYRGQSIDLYKKEFSDLLQQAKGFAGGSAKRVVVLAIPDYGVAPFVEGKLDPEKIHKEIQEFNAAAKQVTEGEGAAFVDIFPLSAKAKSDPEMIASDNLHFSGKLYRLWAEAALPAAKAALQ